MRDAAPLEKPGKPAPRTSYTDVAGHPVQRQRVARTVQQARRREEGREGGRGGGEKREERAEERERGEGREGGEGGERGKGRDQQRNCVTMCS